MNIRNYVILIMLLCSGCSIEPKYCHRGPLYCYSTLGSANCYTTPQKNQEYRLIALQKNTLYNTPQKCDMIEHQEYNDDEKL